MNRLWTSLLVLALASTAAFGQNAPSASPAIGIAGAYNASPQTCTNGQACWLQTDANGKLQVGGSFSSSISGFQPATTGTPISVTTGGVTGTLPAGTVVTVFNVGATNTAFCKLGASATTSDIAIPPASWFAYTVGAATQLTCITSTSTTTVNMIGGSGLPTGAGGGGGGSGGGGAVTVADGADVTQGAKADAAYAGSGSASVVAALKGIYASVNGAIPAGTNTIGNVVNVPTSASGQTTTNVTCGSAVSSCVLKASAGNLYGVYANCTSACWLMVFNATSLPANGATTAGSASGNLVECVPVAAGDVRPLVYSLFPRAFSVGITVAISSTACATLTASTVGFVSGSVL